MEKNFRRDSSYCQFCKNIKTGSLTWTLKSNFFNISLNSPCLVLVQIIFGTINCLLNFLPQPFTKRCWVTCQSKFNVFVSWIKKKKKKIQWSYREYTIIWSLRHPATRISRHLTGVSIWNISIFVFLVKDWNKYVIQRLLFLKYNFLNKS